MRASKKNSRKQDEELRFARELLVCIGEDPRRWSLVPDDRPDVLATDPSGRTFGLELTQLIVPDDGQARAMEIRLCDVISEVVLEFIRELGGRGGCVFGTNDSIPLPGELVEGFRRDLRAHLDRNGAALAEDNGEISEPFLHEWGQINSISRLDTNGEVFRFASDSRRLPHNEWKEQSTLEEMVLLRIANKIEKARHYASAFPLWLAIRNINDVLTGLSGEARESIKSSNAGAFDRITVFHSPWDILDAHPIGPRYVDVL